MVLNRVAWLVMFSMAWPLLADELPSSTAIFDGVDLPKPLEQESAKPVIDSGFELIEKNKTVENTPSPEALRDNMAEAANKTAAPQFEAVQIYSQEDLVKWINSNTHLVRVKEDECQLVQDIEARADKMRLPTYQFLWGDMLAWGVCVEKNAELGIHYMWLAAQQGFPASLEQLGRYYWKGILVQADPKKAMPLLREAASLGHLQAQIEFVEFLNAGLGSPYDYEDAYRWLHGAIISDKQQHQKARQQLALLANKMPDNVVRRAKMQAAKY